MSLAPGTRIGAYQIASPLGAGGMGEVYRARDTKLGRQVAVKILPDDFVKDPSRVARFQREAQALAALNHPHIAQIYGFDDTGDIHALVMELVEGPTLADRIAQGPIPLDEALPMARQLAEALEAAHEQGIIHRDLKPANIKVRPDGTVKVLDFGLAKLTDADMAATASAMTQSPTITSPAMMTGAGMLLGTAAYMAPEQARGKTVDKRADIWAFGCVLYEMLTGQRTFAKDDVSDTLAMVLMKEPDWSHLPAATPPAIRTLLRRCLEKDRKRRLPDIGVARLEIDDAVAPPASLTESATKSPRSPGRRLAWPLAAVATAAAIALAALHFSEPSPEPGAPIRFSVLPPADTTLAGEGQWLSPNGRHLAFRVAPSSAPINQGPAVTLAIRSFDDENVRILVGTEGVSNAFWSPDGRFLAFFAAGKLQKIDVTGGPPQVICDAPIAGGGSSTGGTWGRDGTIIFGNGAPGTGLFRVASGGGTPVAVTKLGEDEVSHPN
jgi:serine/threonine protein kinase